MVPSAAIVLALAVATFAAAASDGSEVPRQEDAELFASFPGAGDSLGGAVAVSAGTIVVGAPFDDVPGVDSGSAWVYVEPAGGWGGPQTQNARLLPSQQAAGESFGYSVAIDGDVVVVGAPLADCGAGEDCGVAYVFLEPAGGWIGTRLNESATLVASAAASDCFFGSAVAIAGDTIVVGAAGDDGGGEDSGAAYVFVRPASGWSGVVTPQAKLIASDRASGDYFGIALSISGDTVATVASNDSPRGSAYVHLRPPGGWAGTLVQSAKLAPSSACGVGPVQSAVSLTADAIVLAVHALLSPLTADVPGAACLFSEPAGGWSGNLFESAVLEASDGDAGDRFGVGLALLGDRVAVGASLHDESAGPAGGIFLFDRPPGGWIGTLTETTRLVASEGGVDDRLGADVAMSTSLIVAGAPGDDGSANDAGSAYVFALRIFADGFESGDTAGWTVAVP